MLRHRFIVHITLRHFAERTRVFILLDSYLSHIHALDSCDLVGPMMHRSVKLLCLWAIWYTPLIAATLLGRWCTARWSFYVSEPYDTRPSVIAATLLGRWRAAQWSYHHGILNHPEDKAHRLMKPLDTPQRTASLFSAWHLDQKPRPSALLGSCCRRSPRLRPDNDWKVPVCRGTRLWGRTRLREIDLWWEDGVVCMCVYVCVMNRMYVYVMRVGVHAYVHVILWVSV
jgi:hypothetical protein